MTTRPNGEVTQSTPADAGTHAPIGRMRESTRRIAHTRTRSPCSAVVCKYRNKAFSRAALRSVLKRHDWEGRLRQKRSKKGSNLFLDSFSFVYSLAICSHTSFFTLNVFDNSPLWFETPQSNTQQHFPLLATGAQPNKRLPPATAHPKRETSVSIPIPLPPAGGMDGVSSTFPPLRATTDNGTSRFYQLRDLSLHWETARGLRGEKPGLISNKTIRRLLQAHWARFPAEDHPAKTTAKMNFLWCININFILFNTRPNLFVDILEKTATTNTQKIFKHLFSIYKMHSFIKILYLLYCIYSLKNAGLFEPKFG